MASNRKVSNATYDAVATFRNILHAASLENIESAGTLATEDGRPKLSAWFKLVGQSIANAYRDPTATAHNIVSGERAFRMARETDKHKNGKDDGVASVFKVFKDALLEDFNVAITDAKVRYYIGFYVVASAIIGSKAVASLDDIARSGKLTSVPARVIARIVQFLSYDWDGNITFKDESYSDGTETLGSEDIFRLCVSGAWSYNRLDTFLAADKERKNAVKESDKSLAAKEQESRDAILKAAKAIKETLALGFLQHDAMMGILVNDGVIPAFETVDSVKVFTDTLTMASAKEFGEAIVKTVDRDALMAFLGTIKAALGSTVPTLATEAA